MKNDVNVLKDTGIITLKNGAGFKQNLLVQAKNEIYSIQITVDDYCKDSYAKLKKLEEDLTFSTVLKKDLEKDFKLNLFEKVELKKDTFKPVIENLKKIVSDSLKTKEKTTDEIGI